MAFWRIIAVKIMVKYHSSVKLTNYESGVKLWLQK